MSEKEKPKSKLRIADETVDGEIVESRAVKAYQLKRAGYSLSEICEELKYNTPGEVTQAINAQVKYEASYLTDSQRESILGMEMARLDELYKAFYPSAMYGDPKAGDMCLKISDRRMKWAGMDMPDMSAGQAQILVIGGEQQNYLDKLKELSGG